MQTTSATWKALWAAGTAWLETRATINGNVYTEMSSPVITRALTQYGMTVGNAVSATCQFSILTEDTIPRAATVVIEQRLNDGTTQSEWLPAGTFFISRRTRDAVTGLLTLECYDALLKANAEMPTMEPWTTQANDVITTQTGELICFGATYPSSMAGVAASLAATLGVQLDSRTVIRTGAAYMIEKPEPGTTIHDVLALIAAANGGNWVITPANRLRLVPVVSAAGAASATENVIDVAGVTGAVVVHTAGTVTGIRYQYENEPVVLGDESGIVIDADVGAVIASDLYDDMIGMTYQAYSLNGAIYDPAAELGDYVRGGANGEVSGVLYGETAVLALAFRGNISAPESGEMSDEYPYIGASKKTLTAAKVYAAQQVAALDNSLDQESVFNRLTGNGAAQGIYMADGQLYINGSYIQAGTILATLIKGGTLKLGGLNNANGLLQVLDGSGNAIGTWNNSGIQMDKGSLYFPVNLENAVTGYVAINSIGKPFDVRLTNTQGETRSTTIDNIGISLENETNGDTVKIWPYMISVRNRNTSYDSSMMVESYDANDDRIMFAELRTSDNASGDFLCCYSDSLSEYTVLMGVDGSGFFRGNVRINGNLTVNGTKSRMVSTEAYSDRLLYCYETPSPLFGDVGEGVIGEDGRCYVALDAVFAQTISTEQYQVFLQAYGDGECWVAERRGGCFVVQGAPGLAFGWEVKAKQRDYDQRRLDRTDEPFTVPEQSYGADAARYINELQKGRVSE